MHNDEPTLLDALDREPLIREVSDAVATCAPPQVFGVHGDWGLGKTSFLHRIQWRLTGDCPQQPEAAVKEAKEREQENNREKYEGTIRAIWFDAWRYQNEEAPIVALLHEMRVQLSWRSRAVRSTCRAVEVATRGALLSMEELTKKIGYRHSRFLQASREWEAENLASALPSHTLREHLQKAIGQLLPQKQGNGVSPRLAVFIDDVDRCEPEAAYRLLEGLKIYLTLNNCVFVLGMNQKAIEEAIAKRMGSDPKRTGGDGTRSVRAAAYMEKLCQNVWRLPAVREPNQVLYSLLEKTIESGAVREWIKRAVQGRQCLPPNPRRLKGLANLLGRLSPRLPARQGEPDDEDAIQEARLLVITAYVYQFHHDLYVRWEADSGLYDRIRDWCEGSEMDLPFLEPLVLPKQLIERGSTDRTQLRLDEGEISRTVDEIIPGESSTERAQLRQGEADIEEESTYPDPTEAGVFWIQPLILALGSEVDPSRFDRYLHGTPV